MKQTFAIALLSLASTMPLIHEPSGYAISVNIRPEGAGANASPYELLAPQRALPTSYICTVDVTDLASKATMTGPKVVVAPGGKETRGKTIDGLDIAFTTSVSRAAEQATWDVVLRRGGQVVTRQHSDTMLRAPVNRR
jgi:hypothetical protein